MARRLRLSSAGIALLALAVALVPGAAVAAPGPCGDRVLDDWYDGRIDGVYAPECYAQALEALPEDVRVYSTAEEDINRALRQRLTGLAAEPAAKEAPAPEQPAEAPAAAQPQEPPAAEAEQPQPPPRSLAGRDSEREAAAGDDVAAAPAAGQPPAVGRPAWAWAAAGFAAVLVAAAVPLALRRWRRAGA